MIVYSERSSKHSEHFYYRIHFIYSIDLIRSNILTNLSGRTWKAFVETEQVNDFKTELASLSTKLNGATVVHIAHVTEAVSSGGKSIFENSYYELH